MTGSMTEAGGKQGWALPRPAEGSAFGNRLFAPSALRNRDVILQMIRPHLPVSGIVLEVASGSGEHVVHFAAALPHLQWQPSDPAPDARASIDEWASSFSNIRPALALEATEVEWPVQHAEVVLCINMIHIAPWGACEGLLAGASRVLGEGGLLALYGPYRRAGTPMEPGNAAFDADLRRRNPDWGLREVETVSTAATGRGFGAPCIAAMPADNLMLLFRRLANP